MQLDEAGHRESLRYQPAGRGSLGEAPPADDGPPIYDPFVAHDEPAPPAAGPSSSLAPPLAPSLAPSLAGPQAVEGPQPVAPRRTGVADWALVFGLSTLLMPLFAPVAVVLGILGIRRARRMEADGLDPRRSRFRARVGLVIGLASLTIGMVGFGLGVYRYRAARAEAEAVVAGPTTDRKRSAIPVPDPDDVAPYGTVPQKTQDELIGKFHVVTLGVQEASLESALRREMVTAKASGTEILLVTTRAGCEPCDGLQASFPNDLMQDALGQTRVVIVDVDVYGDDLDALGIDHSVLAGFFLLAPSLSPRDAIHGGEWGEDIAVNIAPVLGPFVRGAFDARKFDYRTAHRFPEGEARSRRRSLAPSPPAQPAQPPPSGIWL